jgi:hypothetical protein
MFSNYLQPLYFVREKSKLLAEVPQAYLLISVLQNECALFPWISDYAACVVGSVFFKH